MTQEDKQKHITKTAPVPKRSKADQFEIDNLNSQIKSLLAHNKLLIDTGKHGWDMVERLVVDVSIFTKRAENISEKVTQLIRSCNWTLACTACAAVCGMAVMYFHFTGR